MAPRPPEIKTMTQIQKKSEEIKSANLSMPSRFVQTKVKHEFDHMRMQKRIMNACPGKKKPLDALKKMKENSLKDNARHDDIVLIIVCFQVKYEDVFQLHEILYRKTFPKIIYCGHQKKSTLSRDFSFVFFRDVTSDHELFYTCVDEAMQVYSKANGYLLISDDALFFHWNVNFSNVHKVWYRKPTDSVMATYDLNTLCHSEWGLEKLTNCRKSEWTPITRAHIRKSALQAMTELKQSNVPVLNECFDILSRKNGGPFRINYQWRIADVFYVPSIVRREFQLLSRVFARNSLIHALAFPTIAQCLTEYSGVYLLPGLNDVKSRPELDKAPWNIIRKVLKSNQTHVHPYKMSSLLSRTSSKHKDYFCDELIPLFYSH